MLKKRVLLFVFTCFLMLTVLSVDLDYWALQAPYGTGAVSRGSLSVYTNPAALILQTKWEANFLSTIWQSTEGDAYKIFGVNVIQPFQNGFAGSLDILYGALTDPDNDDRYASFGYAMAGKLNDLAWGARIVAGRFDQKDDDDAYYGSANFGLMYNVAEHTRIMINANAPQIITSNATLFEKNRPESFWVGGGLMSSTEDARAYLSVQGYSKETDPMMSANFGGGFKVGFLNFDLSLSMMDFEKDLNLEKIQTYGNGMIMLDFQDFGVGLSASIPLHGVSLSDTKYSLFVSARW